MQFTSEMLVSNQSEAAASPRSDSTLSAPHSTQNSPKPARYVYRKVYHSHITMAVKFSLSNV